MPWLVDVIQEVVDVPFCLDTTNVTAIEAGIQKCKHSPIINSTDATEQRMSTMMPLAAKYNCGLIALALGESGLPPSAEARLELVMGNLMPAAETYGLSMENIYLDPLVLTVNGMQDQALQTVLAVQYFKELAVPPPKTTCGLSNVSNGVPNEVRPMVNEVFMAMMLGAGITSAIANPLEEGVMNVVKIIEGRDTSTAVGKIYVELADAIASGDEFTVGPELLQDPETAPVAKTINMLYNRQIYAHSYLTL
jgi:5-methyltetrahydrofolate corrinoid/iron sulfur protein methyltransferase